MLIGITGYPPAGSGKDTTADYLVLHHDFVKIGLADVMKRAVQELFLFSDEQLYGPSEKRNEPDARYLRVQQGELGHAVMKGGLVPAPEKDIFLTPRYALQQLGTEYGRNCYKDVWVDYLIRVYEKLQDGYHYYDQKTGLRSFSPCGMLQGRQDVVVPDVRYDNEAAAIKKAGGTIWCLYRDSAGLTGAAAAHSSERGVGKELIDQHINNNGGKDELYNLVEVLMLRYKEKKQWTIAKT